MKIDLKHTTLISGLFLTLLSINSQDIEQIADAPILTTNGGIAFNQIANFSPDTNTVLTPYTYYLSGNINFNLYGVVNMPFSFAYTNNQVSSQLPQPFNRFSLSPSYKWVTTHIGYTSMSFSPYTLAGHEFLGGGVELTPNESFKISGMFGRLRQGVSPDTLGTEPSYHRLGGGLKFDYTNKKIDFGINVFKAKDDINSIHYGFSDSTFLKPKDNITGSAMVNVKLINNFSVMAEYAISVMNHDISRNDSLYKQNDFFIQRGGDMAYYYAFKTSASQSSKIGRIGATYEIVSPNYNTLGAYYFTNDFENITANFSTSIKQWFNFGMDVGYQRDNLSEQKTNTSTRFIYSGNASTLIAKKLTISAYLSNIQSYIHIRDIYDNITQTNEFQNLDTLSFTQLNLTESVNMSYLLKNNKQQRQNINLGFTYQEASEQQADDQRFTGNKIYNAVASYQFSLIPQRFNASLSANYNRNLMPEMHMNVMSYNLSLQKALNEQLRVGLIGTYSNSSNSGQGTIANIVNLRVNGGYVLKKRHNFNLSLAMVNNNSIQGTSTQYSANLAYNYMFNFQVKREEKKFGFEGAF